MDAVRRLFRRRSIGSDSVVPGREGGRAFAAGLSGNCGSEGPVRGDSMLMFDLYNRQHGEQRGCNGPARENSTRVVASERDDSGRIVG